MKQKPLIFTLAVLAAAGSSAFGQVRWTPANIGPQNWNVTSNWNGANVPDTAAETASFGNNGPGSPVSRLSNNATYTINQDVSSLTIGGFQINLNSMASAFASGGAIGGDTVTVAAGANFRVGDSITGTGLPTGTTVTNVSGNDLTVSNNFTLQAAGNYTPSNFGTTVDVSGNDITLGNTTNSFALNAANAGSTSLINVSNNVVFGSGTTAITGLNQGTTAVSNGVNYTGVLSGSGNVTWSTGGTLNNASNTQSGTWTLNGLSSLTVASHSLGTATYKVASANGSSVNSQLKFTDSSNFAVTNLIADTGAWSQNITGGGGSGGVTVVGGVTGTFSNFEVGFPGVLASKQKRSRFAGVTHRLLIR